jgi:hypothetical protein
MEPTDYILVTYFHTAMQIIADIASLTAVIFGVRNARKIQDVHVSINSRMDQLLQARGEAEKAAGIVEGRREVGVTGL